MARLGSNCIWILFGAAFIALNLSLLFNFARRRPHIGRNAISQENSAHDRSSSSDCSARLGHVRYSCRSARESRPIRHSQMDRSVGRAPSFRHDRSTLCYRTHQRHRRACAAIECPEPSGRRSLYGRHCGCVDEQNGRQAREYQHVPRPSGKGYRPSRALKVWRSGRG
jgi:hypothetical protein